jgi:hypothetical protein
MWWVGFESTGWTDEGLCEYRKPQPYEKRCLGWNLNGCEIAVWKIVLLAIGVANNTPVQLDNRASLSCEVGRGLDPSCRLNHWDIPQMRIELRIWSDTHALARGRAKKIRVIHFSVCALTWLLLYVIETWSVSYCSSVFLVWLRCNSS